MKKTFKRTFATILCFCLVLTSVLPGFLTASAISENLALNKPAIASDVEDGTSFTADLAVDGDTKTRWASNTYSAGPKDKWIMIDLEKVTQFDLININFEQLNIINYRVEVSSDAGDNKTWAPIYTSDKKITTKNQTIQLETPTEGHYLRVYVSSYDGSWRSVSIFEIEIFDTADVVVEDDGYTIWPTPQKMIESEDTVKLTDSLNVIVEDGLLDNTKARLEEVLENNNITVDKYSNEASSTLSNLYLGVDGSGGLADSYEGLPRDVFDITLTNNNADKYDSYVLQIHENGDIVILGLHDDAVYYALATLEQILEQSKAKNLKTAVFEDYAVQKYRGAVEGFYGYPWSAEGLIGWMEYAKRYKMNTFMYAPKSDPYHLGKWDEDYPTELTEDEVKQGVLTKNEMTEVATVAAKCNVDFIWSAHPFMQKPIELDNKEVADEGIARLMKKFELLYDMGVRQFGIGVDDIDKNIAVNTKDMQAYLLDELQTQLYSKYNLEDTNPEDMVKEIFFTPTYYTSLGVNTSYLSAFNNVHKDVVFCYTGSSVFSNISNSDAQKYAGYINNRALVLWWNYPVNDDYKDSDYYTFPMNTRWKQDASIPALQGVISNPMSFSEASKVSFFGIADYTWNSKAFDANKNWKASMKSIIRDDVELAEALETVFAIIPRDKSPLNVTLNYYYSNFNAANKEMLQNGSKEFKKIYDSIEMIKNLKNHANPLYQRLAKEIEPAMNRVLDMTAAIYGTMDALSSDDPFTVHQGYHRAMLGADQVATKNNPRYFVPIMKGAGEKASHQFYPTEPSQGEMRPFVDEIIKYLDNITLPELSPDVASIESVSLTNFPRENEVRQGTTFEFTYDVNTEKSGATEVIWTIEGAEKDGTFISPSGVLNVDIDETAKTVKVVVTSAYDSLKSDEIVITVTDKIYIDPTIPTNLAPESKILGASGNPTPLEVPEKAIDNDPDTKWCPGGGTVSNQWFALDLGAQKTISTWETIHAGPVESTDMNTYDFSLQKLKAENPTEEELSSASYLSNSINWETVAEYKENLEDITTYKFDTPIDGRYFRFYVARGAKPGASYAATRIYETKIVGIDTEKASKSHKTTIDSSIVNGEIIVDAENIEEGAKVNIQVVPDTGYKLKPSSLKYNGNVILNQFFIMPAEDVVLTAEFILDDGAEVVDKTVLRAKLDEIEALSESTYTPESWTALMVAKANAEVIMNFENATQTVVDAVVSKLTSAITSLVENPAEVVDKTVLRAKLDEIEALSESTYTAESWTALMVAKANAEVIMNFENATQTVVDAVVSKLTSAITNLVENPVEVVDKTVLRAKLDEIEALSESTYTAESWTALMVAKANAEVIMNFENATQIVVDAVVSKLTSAITNLVENPVETVDKTVLRAKLDEIEALNESTYTPESWTALMVAKANAEVIMNFENATQIVVDAVVSKLTSAITSLVIKEEPNIAAAKKILKKTIDRAEKLKSEGALDGTMAAVVKEFNEALAKGKEVMTSDTVTTREVMDATLGLMRAIAKVDWKDDEIDKAVLIHLVKLASITEAKLDQYVEKGKQEFIDAMAEARVVIADDMATQEEVDAMIDKLFEAWVNLRYIVNKSLLKNEIQIARNIDRTLYTTESLAKMDTSVINALITLDDVTANQDKVDGAQNNLKDDIDNLVPIVDSEKNNAQTKPSLDNTAKDNVEKIDDKKVDDKKVDDKKVDKVKTAPKTSEASIILIATLFALVSLVSMRAFRKRRYK